MEWWHLSFLILLLYTADQNFKNVNQKLETIKSELELQKYNIKELEMKINKEVKEN